MIPVLSLYIQFKDKLENFSVALVIKYFVDVVFVFILSKIATYVVRFLLDIDILPTSTYYSIIAMAVAIILPFIKKWFSLKIVEREAKNEKKQ